MRADAFGPAAVTGLAGQAPRRSLHRGDSTDAALASTAGTEVRRWRAGLRDKVRRALSPPVLGRRCGVNAVAFNITGCCTHARRSVRQAHSRRACAQPPLCLAPLGLRGHRLGVPSPCPPNTEACAHPGYRLRKSQGQAPQAAQSWSWPPPAQPSAPRGGSRALSTVLAQRSAVLAASRVRFAASRP